jgi:hypothetical protein
VHILLSCSKEKKYANTWKCRVEPIRRVSFTLCCICPFPLSGKRVRKNVGPTTRRWLRGDQRCLPRAQSPTSLCLRPPSNLIVDSSQQARSGFAKLERDQTWLGRPHNRPVGPAGGGGSGCTPLPLSFPETSTSCSLSSQRREPWACPGGRLSNWTWARCVFLAEACFVRCKDYWSWLPYPYACALPWWTNAFFFWFNKFLGSFLSAYEPCSHISLC